MEINSYRKDHQNFQRFCLVVTVAALGFAGFVYWDSQSKIEKARETSYVSVNGFSYPVEARVGLNYPERIHEFELMVELFYEWRYSADEASIKNSPSYFEKALNMVEPGESSDREIDLYELDRIKKTVLEEGWTYEVQKDSILWDIWDESGRVLPKPWKGYIFGKQSVTVGRKTSVRKMNVAFEILDAPSGVRTRDNPFAAWLRNIDVFNNSKIVPTGN